MLYVPTALALTAADPASVPKEIKESMNNAHQPQHAYISLPGSYPAAETIESHFRTEQALKWMFGRFVFPTAYAIFQIYCSDPLDSVQRRNCTLADLRQPAPEFVALKSPVISL
jgi:hypothetical protein